MSGSLTYNLVDAPPSFDLIKRSDGVVFPPDPTNAYFAAWQSWVSAGNKPSKTTAPKLFQAAIALMATGLTVTSTAAPTLNGTYRTDGIALLGMQAEANAILLAGATPVFADGSTSLLWPDASGAGHTFTPAQFLELVHAVNYFVSQCAQYAAGVLTTVPLTTATIP